MVRSRLFVFLAVAVCLAACLYVIAAADTDDDDDDDDNDEYPETQEHKNADKAVRAVAYFAQNALDSAKKSLNQANSIYLSVQSYRRSAQNAITQANDVPNENTKAADIAAEVKATEENIIALYQNANTVADTVVKNMTDMVTKAKALVTTANIPVEPATDKSNDYTQVHAKVTEVTANVREFEKEMKEKAKLLQPARTLESEMSGLVKKVKVGIYHCSVTLSVSKIDNLLKNADVDIGKTEEKRDEVNNTLKAIRELSTKATNVSPFYVNRVIENAESALDTASKAVDAAKKVREEMKEIKTNAEASLKKFESETNPRNVEGEVRKTKTYADNVANKAPGIAKALQLANITATNTESSKQSFIRALSSGSTQPSIKNNKIISKPGETLMSGEKALMNPKKAPSSTTNTESNTQDFLRTLSKSNNEPSGEETNDPKQTFHSATDALQKDLKVNPTMINAEKTETQTFKNALHQASEKPTIDKREQPKVTNLNILKEKLQRGTKNGTTIPLVNGNPSDLSVLGDSSVTLSVPLLAALIASAVLH